MSYETIPIEAEYAGTVHVLVGTIKDINEKDGTVDVDIDDYGSFADIPVFYHCQEDKDHSSEAADGMPFLGDERVIIVNHGDTITLSVSDMKVVGFEDGLPRKCPIETVYVVMKVKNTERCFVWKIEDGEYAAVNDNEGSPASFPCDPADISTWVDNQESVGEGLLRAHGAEYDCGRGFSGFLGLDFGDWNTAGSISDSEAELSDCEGCNFTNTAQCEVVWDFTMECKWNSTPPPGHWSYAGSASKDLSQSLLWGRDIGWPPVHYGSRRVEFRNNSEVKDAFRVEVQASHDKSIWSADGAACGGTPCDNIRLDSSVITQNYKFHTPIAKNIFQIVYTETGNCNGCADTGVRSQENFVVPMQLKVYGAYSEKIIVQAYFTEVQTITRQANCNWVSGACFGSGCVGGSCPWAEQTFTFQGLSMVAQADVLEDTDGIDPTGLPRNNPFEDAINELYNVLRVAESIPSDEIAGARLTALHVLKGV